MDDGSPDPLDAAVRPHDVGRALREIARTVPVPVTVRGASMAPVLRDGDQVVLESRSWYWPGDVVAFQRDDGWYVVHRVVGYRRLRGAWVVVTRGDAARTHDSPVRLDRVIGRVTGGSGGDRAARVRVGQRLLAWARFARLVAAFLARRVGLSR